jgi:diguanylate cyclase (GGDEF)-like protein
VATIAYVVFGVAYIYANRKRINKYMIMPIALIISPIFIGAIIQAVLPGTAIIAMVVTISLVGLYATTQSESAYIDRLSGVYNRRYLDDYLTGLNENEKFKKTGKTITGIMLDMDKFKQINDTFGHHVGDDAISQVGKILIENLGKMNFAARYGGDEFIIITPMLDRDSIENLMQKLTDVADERNASGDYPYELSFSYGYAQFTVGKEKDSDGFMKRMDDNMYEYKVAKKARWAAEGKKTKQEEAAETVK